MRKCRQLYQGDKFTLEKSHDRQGRERLQVKSLSKWRERGGWEISF